MYTVHHVYSPFVNIIMLTKLQHIYDYMHLYLHSTKIMVPVR